jgi:hypothetical protein
MALTFSDKWNIHALVEGLLSAIRADLQVSGQLDFEGHCGVAVTGGYPKCIKPGTELVRWLIERSTAEGSVDSYLWTKCPHLANVAELLGDLQELLEYYDVGDVRPLRNSFNRLLRQKLFTLSFEPWRDGEEEDLYILFHLIKSEVLLDLHETAHALGTRKPKRTVIQQDPRLEERAKTIYEEACEGKPYKEIQRLVNRKYPHLTRISTESGVWEAARRYAERNGLPPPPGRHQRRS